VARILGVAEVIVPPALGAASALGFLAAPVSFEFARSAPAVLDDAFDFAAISRLLAEIEAEGRRLLAEAGITGGITVSRQAEMRLLGQMHEITVGLPDGALGRGNLDDVKRRFAATYTRLYTHLYARRGHRGAKLAGPGIRPVATAIAGQRAGGEQSPFGIEG